MFRDAERSHAAATLAAVAAVVAAAGCASHSDGVAGSVAAARPLSNHLRWTTTAETRCAGFDVYRAEGEAESFERVTKTPIACAAAPQGVDSDYEYIDRSIESGRRYRYYVETIRLDGTRAVLTPVREAPVKGVRTGDS